MKLSNLDYLKWGFEHHPGNIFYVAIYMAVLFVAIAESSWFGLGFGWLVFGFLHFQTSLNVGYANRKTILKQKQEEADAR